LNHSNVATKYILEGEEEGERTFKLFPTNTNSYSQGSEVFNSYGRRTNDHLVSEYGFAIEDNEWDGVDMQLGLGKEDELRGEKIELCYLNDLSASKFDLLSKNILMMINPNSQFSLFKNHFPFKILRFLRILMLETKEDVDGLVEECRFSQMKLNLSLYWFVERGL